MPRKSNPTVNKQEQESLKILDLIQNVASLRRDILRTTQYQFGDQRNPYQALGWKNTLTFDDYYTQYERGGIARTCICAYPDATWKGKPLLVAPDAGEAWWTVWNTLAEKLKLIQYCRRVDILANIGHYSVLFLGFNDSVPLDQPVTPSRTLTVNYLQAFSEGTAEISSFVQDVNDPRYGQPEYYTIQMEVTDLTGFGKASRMTGKETEDSSSSTIKTGTTKVHWSRCIHVAENLLESEVFGEPRIRAAWNYLEDLNYKVAGGSAEMFWRGAFPGLAFNLDPEVSLTEEQKTEWKTQINNYIQGLQRALRLQGVTAQTLSMQVADPSNHAATLIDLIAGSLRIPKRILIGSERGELASSQDEANWASRIEERRDLFAGPCILLAFVQRLIDLKIIKQPGKTAISIEWPSQQQKDDKKEAETNQIRVTTLSLYFNSGIYEVIPLEAFLIQFMAFSEEAVEEWKAAQPEVFERIDDEPGVDEEESEGPGTEEETSAQE